MVGRRNCPVTVERLVYTGQFEARRRYHCRLPVGHSGPHRTGDLKRFGIVEWAGDGKFIEPAKKGRERKTEAPPPTDVSSPIPFEPPDRLPNRPSKQTKLS